MSLTTGLQKIQIFEKNRFSQNSVELEITGFGGKKDVNSVFRRLPSESQEP